MAASLTSAQSAALWLAKLSDIGFEETPKDQIKPADRLSALAKIGRRLTKDNRTEIEVTTTLSPISRSRNG